ncbi:MAG: ABC transporter substrate-binding protein [Chloroflexi bacterium]|nr:ABC transporter substrate-binding protein [Chloroflexota bacterium]
MRVVPRLVLGLFLGLGALTGPAAAKQSDGITVGYSNIAGDEIPLWVAADEGFFDAHGLNVDAQLLAGGANTVAALLSGQVQFAHAGGSEALNAAANGADLAVVAMLAPVYPYIFEASPEIKSVDDLVGKTIGVATVGGSADVATRVVLRQQGLDPARDVTIVATGSSQNRTAALVSGAIQAGMAGGPPDTLDLESRGLHPLIDLAALRLPAANTSVIAQRSWLTTHRQVAQRYVDSLIEATTHLKQDKPGTVTVLKKYYKSEDDAAMAATYDFHANEVLASLPMPRAEQFADALDQLGQSNPRVREVDLGNLLDPTFVQDAADRGLGGGA